MDKKIITIDEMDWGSRAGLIASLLSEMPWEMLKKEKEQYEEILKKHPYKVPALTEAGQYSANAYNAVLDIAEEFQKKFKQKPRDKFGKVPLFKEGEER
jgi:hypothetical protein